MKQTLTFVSLIAVLFLTGCYDPHAQDSPIVREVQAAGAGNLSTFTYQGLAEWFSHRPAFTKKIYAECVSVAQNAPANWTTTAEGTTCHAAQVMLPPPDITADTRTW